MDAAHEWYAQLIRAADKVVPRASARPHELGKADLYFFMTDIIHRVDLRREWIFQRCREVQE
jgi:hypothetical protein